MAHASRARSLVFVSPLLLVLAAGCWLPLSAAGAAPAQAAKAAERDAGADALPIRRITLYRSGVGAFQREGTVAATAKVELKFDITQINDILKSLQLLDLDGGRIDSVSYPSKDPLARRLGAFSVPIADSPSIPNLLGRLRGAGVDVKTIEGAVSGTILSVESRKVAGGKDEPAIDTMFLNLVTSAGIRSFPIPTITSFQLQDKQLADELNRALAAVADARGERLKTIDLSLSGEGNRRVIARYVHETPVWKTSYRLVISDTPEQKQGGKTVPGTLALQGWAIVENTTDTDWKDVKLSLVSGRPVSFTMDLSEPLYLARPDIPVPTIPGVLPRSYEGGVATRDKAPARPAAVSAGMPADASAARSVVPQSAPAFEMRAKSADVDRSFGGTEISADDLLKYSPAAQARAGEVGEVFFYEVQNPVTVERQRSAMIPFLASNIEGRRVSIYNLGDRPDHPMRGVEIRNTSDLQLLPGPLAVFDGTAYAGDATINQVSPGDKRLLAYALDLDVAVTTKPEQSGQVMKLRIVDGLFEYTVKNVNSMAYTFENKDLKRSRTIVVEHAKLAGWDLTAPGKAAEETQELYRFEVGAEPGKQASVSITQEQVQSQRLEITSFDTPTVAMWHQQGRASAGVFKAVQQLASLQAAVNDLQRQVNDLKGKLDTNTNEQTRVSTTMQRLPQNSEVYGDYMKELKDLNTALRTLRQQHQDRVSQMEAKQKERDDFVRGLNVE